MAKAVHAQSTVCGEKDPRSLGQIRADLALDLLLTGAPVGHDTSGGLLASIIATVSITVPVTTLMGRGTMAAELNGCTPIDPTTARRLAGAASGWDRILTHPITGALLAVDRRHHVLKHHTPWAVAPLTDGLYAWTSPTGQVYIDKPPRPHTVTFAEDATTAPF